MDDPLGDLLSEGSNDSFFGSTKLNNKKPISSNAPSNARAAPPTKTKMEDLFGISSEKKEEKPPDTLSQYSATINQTSGPGSFNLNDNRKPTTPKPRADDSEFATKKVDTTPKPLPKKEIDFGDSNDILSELGFDPKRPKGSGKKTTILDDLLGISESKNILPTPVPNREIPKTPPPPRATQRHTQPEPDVGSMSSADAGRTSNRYSPSLGRSRTTPRTNSGTSLNDPLGFFSNVPPEDTPKKVELDEKRPVRPTKKLSTVDWLGLDPNKETSDISIHPKPSPIQEMPNNQQTAVPVTTANTIQIVSSLPLRNDIPLVGTTVLNPSLSHTIQLMNSAGIDGENALQGLQQQDLQLHIAAQMRAQEAALIDMQGKQQNLLKQQETHFNDLLRRQLSRQTVLEDSIRRQQEQINSHIHLLMAQPSGPMGRNTEGVIALDDQNLLEASGTARSVHVELEAEVKRLELEKMRLEDLLQNIRVNHEHEFELTERSHK